MVVRIISILLTFCLIFSINTAPVFADGAWSDYAKSGAELQNDGSITVTSSDSVIAHLTKSQMVPASYVFTTEVKVSSFSNETGFQINTGKKRLFVLIRTGEIGIGTGADGTRIAYNIGNEYHKYVFDVINDDVYVYIDGKYLGKARLQSNTTAGRIYFWAKSAAGGTAVMNVRSAALEDKQSYKPEGRDLKTQAFEQNWDKKGDWRFTDDRTITIKDGVVEVNRTSAGGVSQAFRNITLSENFDYEFRLKVNKFTDGETGAKIEWSPYRIFFYFYENMLTSRTADGNVGTMLDIGYDWHVWRAQIRGNQATIYMDDAFVISYTMEQYNLEPAIMNYWVKPKADDEPSLSVDWTRYTPVDHKMQISSPIENSVFVEGTSIGLNVTGVEENRKITYYVDGMPLSHTNETSVVWTNIGCGRHTIYAEDENNNRTESVTITAIKGFGANIIVPEKIAYGEVLSVKFTPYNFKGEEISEIDCYIDGKKTSNYEIKGLNVGMHSVYGIVKLKNGLMNTTPVSYVSVTAGKGESLVEEAYEINYTLSDTQKGAGIEIGSDAYLLDIRYGNGEMIYMTDKGAESRNSLIGKYKISVDSGQAVVYEKGKFAFSFYMPRAENAGVNIKDDSNILADCTISGSPEKGCYYIHRGEDAQITASGIEMSQNYALEFDKTDNSPEHILLYDSGYMLDMTMRGDITVMTAPLGRLAGVEKEVIASVPEHGGIYRITVSRGMAQLFIDNKFIASFRIPEYISSPELERSIEKAGKTTFTSIRRTEDLFSFADDFSDGTDYWSSYMVNVKTESEKVNISGTGAYLLNVSANNPQISADMYIKEKSGMVGMYLRYHSDDVWTRVLYNAENSKWIIEEKYLDNHIVAEKNGTIPIGKWFTMEVTADGKYIKALVDGREVISSDNAYYTQHGRLGFCADNASFDVDNVSYAGDGRPAAGIDYLAFNDCHTVDFVETAGRLYMIGAGTNGYKYSSDGGLTWQNARNENGLTSNTLKLKNGRILTIQRIAGPSANTYWDVAKYSDDGGNTFSTGVQIETRVSNRITMNNKITELENGRVIMCVGESGHGMEDYGALGIYYTDNGGESWQEGMPLTIYNTGVNVQEGKIIELPDGVLRCYMRTDRGFVYYSDSPDRGKTWDTALKKSQFISPLNAMNIERDPYNKNTYYMAWEYDNKNAHMTKQFPRFRTALAVSYDGCETWEYVMDLTELDSMSNVNVHANQGVRIFEDKIFVNVVSYEPGISGQRTLMNRVFRIDKEAIKTTKRFNSLHMLEETTLGEMKSVMDKAMVIIPDEGAVMVHGDVIYKKASEQKINAAMFAEQFGLNLQQGSNLKLCFGDIEFESECEMVPVAAVAQAFGKRVVKTGDYIVITSDIWSDSMTKAVDRLLKKEKTTAEADKT